MSCSKLVTLYNKCEKSNINVGCISFTNDTPALCYEVSDDCFWIGLNRNMIHSEREELCALAEEVAHYEVGIIPNDYESNSYADKIVREKNELRAKKRAVRTLIDKEKIIEYLKKNDYIDLSAMADEFDITPEFAHQALVTYGLIEN